MALRDSQYLNIFASASNARQPELCWPSFNPPSAGLRTLRFMIANLHPVARSLKQQASHSTLNQPLRACRHMWLTLRHISFLCVRYLFYQSLSCCSESIGKCLFSSESSSCLRRGWAWISQRSVVLDPGRLWRLSLTAWRAPGSVWKLILKNTAVFFQWNLSDDKFPVGLYRIHTLDSCVVTLDKLSVSLGVNIVGNTFKSQIWFRLVDHSKYILSFVL